MPLPSPSLFGTSGRVVLFCVLASACNQGKRAVEACEELAESLSCGDNTDYLGVLNCNQYAETECDIVDYFDCMEDDFVCDEGIGSFSGTCNELAVCD